MMTSLNTILEYLKEVKDRTRRTETLLNRWAESQGFDTRSKKSAWRADGTVLIPSMSTPISDIIASIPDDWEGDVLVTHKGDFIVALRGDDINDEEVGG
jgi:hypothetical protein